MGYFLLIIYFCQIVLTNIYLGYYLPKLKLNGNIILNFCGDRYITPEDKKKTEEFL